SENTDTWVNSSDRIAGGAGRRIERAGLAARLREKRPASQILAIRPVSGATTIPAGRRCRRRTVRRPARPAAIPAPTGRRSVSFRRERARRGSPRSPARGQAPSRDLASTAADAVNSGRRIRRVRLPGGEALTHRVARLIGSLGSSGRSRRRAGGGAARRSLAPPAGANP